MNKLCWCITLVVGLMAFATPAYSLSITSALPGESGISDSPGSSQAVQEQNFTDGILNPERNVLFPDNFVFPDDDDGLGIEPGLASFSLRGPEPSSAPLEITMARALRPFTFANAGVNGSGAALYSTGASRWDQPASFLASSVWTGGQEPWTAIPEPATIFLLGLGLLLFGRIQRFLRR